MLEDKEVELVEWVKEIDRLTQREADLQARLQNANDMLRQREKELEAERQRVERDALERKKVEEMLQDEVEKLGDAAYAYYEQGFDKALTQVRHFARGTPVNLSKVDREKKLSEILAIKAMSSQVARAAVGGEETPIGVNEEEEGAETPIRYPNLL